LGLAAAPLLFKLDCPYGRPAIIGLEKAKVRVQTQQIFVAATFEYTGNASDNAGAAS